MFADAAISMFADVAVITKHLHIRRKTGVTKPAIHVNRHRSALTIIQMVSVRGAIFVDMIKSQHGPTGLLAANTAITAICRVNLILKPLTTFSTLRAGYIQVPFSVCSAITTIFFNILMPETNHGFSMVLPLAVRACSPKIIHTSGVFRINTLEQFDGFRLVAFLARSMRQVGRWLDLSAPPTFVVDAPTHIARVPTTTARSVNRKIGKGL